MDADFDSDDPCERAGFAVDRLRSVLTELDRGANHLRVTAQLVRQPDGNVHVVLIPASKSASRLLDKLAEAA